MRTEQKPIPTGWGPHATARQVAQDLNLGGKAVVVTGGHSGIGFETTRALSQAGAAVIVGARDVQKAREALAGLEGVTLLPLDLSDPKSVDAFAQAFLKGHTSLDLLLNNAGIMALPLTRDKRGYELQFAVNHLGHFQLTARLWPALKKAGRARVISLSSAGHRFGGVDLEDPNFLSRPYDKWAAYGQSKSANSLFAVALDKRGEPHGIRAFAVHPGRIPSTSLNRYMEKEELERMGVVRENGAFKSTNAVGIKTIEEGAATTLWCAVSPLLEGKGGVYCADCDISPLVADDSQDPAGVRGWAVDPVIAEGLWDLSEKLTGIRWP